MRMHARVLFMFTILSILSMTASGISAQTIQAPPGWSLQRRDVDDQGRMDLAKLLDVNRITDLPRPARIGMHASHPLTIEEATELAFIKARYLWGTDIELGSVIEICDPYGQIYAYDFDVTATGQDYGRYSAVARAAFHERNERLARYHTVPTEKGKHGTILVSRGSQLPRFGYVVISATLDAPPIRASGEVPSAFYSTGWIAHLRARDHCPGLRPILTRLVFMDPYHRWFEFECQESNFLVEGRPPFRIFQRDEFLELVRKTEEFKRAHSGSKDPWPDDEHMQAVREEHRIKIDQLLDNGLLGPSSWTLIANWTCVMPLDWSYGCSPTAGAMVLNFWDVTSWFGRMTYWYYERWDNLQSDWDYQVPTLQYDLKCFMLTDIYGGTGWDDVGPGMRDYVLARGYSFTRSYCRFDVYARSNEDAGATSDWCWDTIVGEIDTGRPFVWSTSYGWGGNSHSACAVGYDAAAQDVIVYDTFDGNLHAYYHAGGSPDRAQIDGGYPYDPVYHDVKLASPLGDTGYDHDGDGEHWAVGKPHEITWNNFGSPGTSVKIFYNLYGGANTGDYRWIATTEDDGSYEWTPPADSISDKARIVIQQYNGDILVSSDGSIGNFFLEKRGKVYFFTTYRYDPSSPRLLVYMPEDSSPVKPAKICGDGSSSATLVSFVSEEVDIADVVFEIIEDPERLQPDVYGAFWWFDATADSVIYRYQHPRIPAIADNEQYTEIHLRVKTQSNDSTLCEYPIHLYRAPVVMLHGLWSSTAAFTTMNNALTAVRWPRQLTHIGNYAPTCDEEFEKNKYVAPIVMREAIFKAIGNGYSAGRVNIVAHSMGGILTRKYIQENDDFDDDICRFITLNTPHTGSQMANFLLTAPVLVMAMQAIGKNAENGAVADLQVDSEEIRNQLNGPPFLNRHTVPSHAIVTEAYVTDVITGWGAVLLTLIELSIPFINLQAFVDNTFGGEDNDIIVAESSQEGGLSLFAINEFSSQWHGGSPDNGSVINWVIFLLGEDPEESIFLSSGGYYPQFLDPPSIPVSAPPVYASVGSVTITAPGNGTVVMPGEEITVSVSGTGDVSKILLVGGNRSLDPFMEVKDIPIATFDYTVPIEAASRIDFAAVGYGDSGYVALDSLYIDVDVGAELDSITIFPDALYLSPGECACIQTTGHFSDSIARDLTHDPAVTYLVLNPGVATFEEPAVITALAVGNTTAEVSLWGVTGSVEVVVSEASILSGIDDYDDEDHPVIGRSTTRLQPNYPNPFNPQTTISYSIPKGSHVRLSIYDVQGRFVTDLVNEYREKGSYRKVWDGRNRNGVTVSSGVYFVRLESAGQVLSRKIVMIK